VKREIQIKDNLKGGKEKSMVLTYIFCSAFASLIVLPIMVLPLKNLRGHDSFSW